MGFRGANPDYALRASQTWWNWLYFTNDDVITWKLFSAVLAVCERNAPVVSGFPHKVPVMRRFEDFVYHTVEQTVKWPVISDAMTLFKCRCHTKILETYSVCVHFLPFLRRWDQQFILQCILWISPSPLHMLSTGCAFYYLRHHLNGFYVFTSCRQLHV